MNFHSRIRANSRDTKRVINEIKENQRRYFSNMFVLTDGDTDYGSIYRNVRSYFRGSDIRFPTKYLKFE